MTVDQSRIFGWLRAEGKIQLFVQHSYTRNDDGIKVILLIIIKWEEIHMLVCIVLCDMHYG